MSHDEGHGGSGKLPGLEGIEHWLHGTNESSGIFIPGWGLISAFLVLIVFFLLFAPEQTIANFALLIFLSPLWLPFVVCRFALFSYVKFRRIKWASEQPTVLLEIRVPQDNPKGPAAMEAVFTSLHLGPGEGTWFKKFYWGRTRPWYSFEIGVIKGKVRFFVWTRKSYRRAVENYIYAQYPEVELIETEDYSRAYDPSHGPYKMFACDYNHTKASPIPMKSYVQHGLNRQDLSLRDEVDPFAQMIEFLGSISADEQVWIQFIIRLTKTERYRGKKTPSGGKYSWREEGREILEKMKKAALSPSGFPMPTDTNMELMSAIERNIGKPGFDVGVRAIYSGPIDKYTTANPFIANIFKSFNSEMYNGIMPNTQTFSEKYNDYPWEDIGGRRQARDMHEAVMVYRLRSFFHPPYRGDFFVMSSEELATLFHIPTRAVMSASLNRKPQVTRRAPPNIPT